MTKSSKRLPRDTTDCIPQGFDHMYVSLLYVHVPRVLRIFIIAAFTLFTYVTQVAGCTFPVAAKFHMYIEAIRADLRPIAAPEDNWPASGRRPEDKKRDGG
jgi:hypothetical protein